MLNKAKILKGYKLGCKDGVIGEAVEFYFDDRFWAVRYLVAGTGDWLANRQVLISPYALREVVREDKLIEVELTKKQIEDSPALESDKPVSRQFENEFHAYYGWPAYYGGPFVWGADPVLQRDPEKRKNNRAPKDMWDPHLRSTKAVSGYQILAEDGVIGHIEDFIIDDETWDIRYLVIDTGDWMPGKKVLISPRWIERIDFESSKVTVALARENIMKAPEYTPDKTPNRDYETRLHLHYKRQGYWGDGPESEVHV